ncbi:hypothetical protein Tco_0146189 [Tanacetum coccineum]
MNPQETQQVVARDEKWVPSAERVKINSTNIRLETTVPQKEETFQVQFGYTIKKVQDTNSYKFLLANKKCIVNAEVFRKILDICLRVEGVDFTNVPDDDPALTFLIVLGYKGPLNRHINMFVDHMHQPWRTLAAIINKCLSIKIASNDKLRKSRIDILLKFVSICEDFQEYGLPVPDVMLTNATKRSKSYQIFIKYSTNQIPPKKSIDKGLKANENIISDDPDAALELAKSVSQTEAEVAEAARKSHATHARIVTESVLESAKKKSSGRSSKSVVIQDTSNIMQALKESKKTSRRQPGTGGSNERTSSKLGVPDESTVVSATSSEGTHAKPEVPDEDKDITEEKVILEWGDEQDSEFSDDDNDDVEKDDKDGDADDEGDDHVSDTQDADDEDVETESDEDEIYKYKIRVRNEEDVEMKDAEVEESDKGEEKVTDAAKEEAEKTSEAKDDTKKSELPPSSSSLSVSSGFGDQFLKLSSDSSLVSTVKDSVDADVSSLLDIPIQHKTPQTQSPSVQKIPVSVIPKTTNLPPIPEIITETPVSTAAPSPQVTPINSSVQQTPTPILTQPITTDAPTIMIAALSAVELRVAKLEKDVSELKIVDHSSEALAHLPELTKKPTPTTEQESEKSPSDILKIKKEQTESQKNLQFTIKSTDKAALEEYDLKSALYQSMHANKSFNRNPANHQLCHALMEALIEDENIMDKGVADTSASAKEPVEEPITEVVMDDIGDDVVCDDYQPQDTSEPKTRKTLNPKWFKQPPRPPTPDPKWNKRQCFNALTDKLDWNNPEGDRYLFNLFKPLLLQGTLGHRTVAADYFFNNDLEYLKTSDIEVTYTTSITKTKAARYEIKGIKDMFPTLWSTIKHAYDKDAKKGIKHWGERRKLCVKKLHGHDMLLFAVQHKLFHLDGNVIVNFIVALRMFTRSLILKRRVEDLQLGVESYQKKLNITKPQKTFPEIEFKEPYTPSYDPPGIVYEDLNK